MSEQEGQQKLDDLRNRILHVRNSVERMRTRGKEVLDRSRHKKGFADGKLIYDRLGDLLQVLDDIL